MLSAVLLLLAQADRPVLTDEIVVVGHRAEQDLAACLARSCPPAEEVEASLQASVEQFADGRYNDAQRTLQGAIRRNHDHAAELPGPVSSLYATLATVAEHQGDERLWLQSARNNVVVLRQHLGETHLATLGQELSFADHLIGLGSEISAVGIYRKVQRTAAQLGQGDLAAGAAFRRAWLALLSRRDEEAERVADEAVALAGGDNRIMLELRDILRARIAIHRGNDGAVEQLAARLRQSAAEKPRLIFAPPLEDINPARNAVQRTPMHDPAIRFADIGYWIRPDGRTSGSEVLRDAGLGPWSPGILRQIGQRRYIPLSIDPGQPGIYRIERYTVRGTIGTPSDSRIRVRMGDLSFHVVDLTETEAMSAAHRKRTQDAAAKPEG